MSVLDIISTENPEEATVNEEFEGIVAGIEQDIALQLDPTEITKLEQTPILKAAGYQDQGYRHS